MRRWITLAIVLLLASLAAAQDITGDWKGTLDAGSAQLRLVLHISKSANGVLQATLDSVDQGANGIPVSSIVLKDSKLSLGVEAVHGTYEGAVSADGKSISGTWTQSAALPLEFKRAVKDEAKSHGESKPSDIDGAWMGVLDTGSIKLHVVFHVVNTADGLTATLDSPDQGVKGMSTSSVTRDGSSLRIEAKNIGGIFQGKSRSFLDRWHMVARRRNDAARPEASYRQG